MIKPVLCAWLGVVTATAAADYLIHSFSTTTLTDQFWAEGAYIGDFNKDGKQDVVSGPFWYPGPDFKQRHEYRPATRTSKRKTADGKEETFPGYAGALANRNEYSDNFFNFMHDLNGDGWDDIIVVDTPGQSASWFENPKGSEGHWKRRVIFDVVDNESPQLLDLTGDGKREILCNFSGKLGYITPNWSSPTAKGAFHPITPQGKYHKYTHGIGAGDVNGDGRLDILEAQGWWEQPASLEGDPVWKRHAVSFGAGGAQMFAYDVNGDGLNDVITSLAAHGYGLAWFEQYKENGQTRFRQQTIINKEARESKYGVHFSQLHAVALVDMNQDGLKDIVTGKRFWAHGPKGDPEPNAPAVLYWFQLVRDAKDGAYYIPHLIHNDSGVGTQVLVADINGDTWPDIIVGNKKGVFVHTHHVKKASREEWSKAQPKPLALK